MNIRALANAATQAVNPNVTATALRNIGSDTDADGKRFARWSTSTVNLQVQGISAKEVQFLAGQGISGTLRQVFAPGYWVGPQKAAGSGGDMFRFPEHAGSELRDWKVVQIKGVYDGWTQAIVQMQSTPLVQLSPNAVAVIIPENGAVNQQLDIALQWERAPGATSYAVHFGQSADTLVLAIDGLTGLTYNPAEMAFDSTYFYRIDSVNSHGVTVGSVRSFSTWSVFDIETDSEGNPETDESGRYLETGGAI